jgi:hypothetical protein
MGWRITTGRDRDSAGKPVERVRASRSEHTPLGDVPPERMEVYVEGVIGRHRQIGTIPADEEDAWRRHLHADLAGACLQLAEREQQLQQEIAQRSRSNGLAGRRPRDDGETIIAAAVQAGKFRAEREPFWRERYRRNPQQTRALIDSLEPLPRLQGGMPHPPWALGAADSGVASVSPQAATRLGLHVQMPHPLAPGGLPGRVLSPPPRGPIHKISDRA